MYWQQLLEAVTSFHLAPLVSMGFVLTGIVLISIDTAMCFAAAASESYGKDGAAIRCETKEGSLFMNGLGWLFLWSGIALAMSVSWGTLSL